MKQIKSILLAAGYGTRLRPITLRTPKCLVEINGKPLLDYWIDKLEKISAKEVIINTHYLADKVENFLSTQKERSIIIKSFHEKKLLGTAGTLIANREIFKDSIGLLIHADNFSEIDLGDLINSHKRRPKNCMLTMLTFNSTNPKSCGIVEIDSNKIVQNFYEKIDNPTGNVANGAIYVFENDFLDWLIQNYPNASDFSNHIIPKLLGRIYTFHTTMTYIDIGTPGSLDQARNFANIKN